MEYNTTNNDIEYQIKNVEIEKIYRNDRGQDGQLYTSKKGNPFKKVDIYIDPRAIEDGAFQGKMTYFDYFGNTDHWEVGSTINGSIIKKVVGDRVYFNFNMPPSGKKAIELDIKEIRKDIKELQEAVFGQAKGHTEEVREAIDFSKKALDTSDTSEEDEEPLPF